MTRPILLFAVLCFGFGCGKQKPTDQHAPDDPGAAPAKEADYTLTAAEFEKEYKADSNATKAKYDGKTLEMSGVIQQVNPNYYANGTTIVFAPVERSGNTMHCTTKGFVPPGSLAKGQTVRVRGKATGTLLMDCVVLEKGADTAVRATAEQLAKDHTADPEKARQKYDDKTLVIKGEIAAVKPDPLAPHRKVIELKGDGQTVVECRFGPSEEERTFVNNSKAGDKVTLAADMLLSHKGRFCVGTCYPVPEKE